MKRYNKLFETKSAELKSREAYLKSADCTASDNTKSTQLVKVRRERKTLNLLKELIQLLPEDTKLSDDATGHLNNMLTLVSERQSAIHFECKAGDKIVDLLQKYSTMNKLMERMQKFCDKNNLVIDFAAGTIIEKK